MIGRAEVMADLPDRRLSVWVEDAECIGIACRATFEGLFTVERPRPPDMTFLNDVYCPVCGTRSYAKLVDLGAVPFE